MILSFITDFAEFLNGNGYSITESETLNLLRLLQRPDFHLENRQQMLAAMRTVFAKNAEQSLQMEGLFAQFMDHHEQIQKCSEYKKEKERNEESIKNRRVSLEDEIIGLQNDRDAAIEMMQKQVQKEFRETESAPLLGKKQDRAKAVLSEMKFQTKKERQYVMEGLLSNRGTRGMTQRQLAEATDKVNALLEREIRNNAWEYVSILTEIQKALLNQKEASKPLEDKIYREGRRICGEYEKKINQVRLRLKAELQKHQEKQHELDKKLQELKPNGPQLTVKEKAVNHRDVFQGKHAVQIYGKPELENTDKPFASLSEQEKEMIYTYIRQNLLGFKTRMTRRIRSDERRTINMEETVKHAIRTGGIPLKLVYNLPKRSKADLIMILDVSGSCKSASEMMLTFIGILKEIFPRGCKAFAFVNTLYDISKIYETSNTDLAVREALSLIPRAGQYSNYEQLLRTMWEKHRRDITKDSIVVFIGDARNNKNASGEEYLKNICRKAKTAFWLNTETKEKWDCQDSIASIYGKYASMREVVTIRQLLHFINEIR